jgi:transcription elongation factor Elf1
MDEDGYLPLRPTKYHWEDCSASFDCPRCGEENIADSQDGWETCGCGMQYIFSAKILFRNLE